ncbi:MAG: TraB/GumN family protein [Bacteroidetes bacterium]|nr:TraB/GumN family protein [Bacteroidota bacterium]
MKFIQTLFILIFLSSISFSQTDLKMENSVFWQVISPSTKDTSYLFGTIHLIDKNKYVLPEEVINALTKCKSAFFEVNDDLNQEEILELSKMKDKTLMDYLDENQIDSLYDFALNVIGADSNIFNLYLSNFKPIVFSQLPMAKVIEKTTSYDEELRKIAIRSKLNVQGFESYESQMSIFDNMPNELVKDFIMETIRKNAEPAKDWARIQEMYLNQNLNEFLADFDENTALNNFLKKELLLKRNDTWVQRLSPKMKSESVFVAVGAAHLAGQNGLVNQLRGRNFAVTPISINFQK